MSAAAITFARAVAPPVSLAKTIMVENGVIVGVKPSRHAAIFEFTEEPVHDLDSLGAAVEAAAGRGDIAVRGAPKERRGRRAIYDDPEKGPAGLEVVPRRWVGFDLDDVPAPDGADPLRDPETGVRLALGNLPFQFRDASCFWQISASAGFKSGYRLRLWYWLDHPTTGEEMRVWVKPALDRELVDPATLVEPQPHYLAVKVIGGPDPCPQRFGFLRLARPEVPVPDLEARRWRQQQQERAERVRTGGEYFAARNPSERQADAERRIDDCLQAVRSATEGQRHPTYKSQAARAKALCDRYGIRWEPVRASLIAAYESTLSATELRQRKKSSTQGVVSWLEARG